LVVQIFVQVSGQFSFAFPGVLLEFCEHRSMLKPLAAMLELVEEHQGHAFVVKLLVNEVEERFDIRESESFYAIIIFAFMGEIKSYADFAVSFCGGCAFLYNLVANRNILTLGQSNLRHPGDGLVSVLLALWGAPFQVVK